MDVDRRTPSGWSLRKAGLRVFLVLLALNALLGIGVVLGGDLGENGGRVLATSLVLTAGVMLALGSASARNRPRLGPAWLAGACGAAAASVLWIVGIWTDASGSRIWQLAGTATIVALAVSFAGLLSHAEIRGSARWTLTVANVVIGALLVLSTIAIWNPVSDASYWRLYGVLSITLAALSIAIPVLHRAERRVAATAPATRDVRFCPNCGTPNPTPAGQTLSCARCASSFTVTFADTTATR